MAQVTFYIDAETDARARAAAKAEGVSYSRWVTELIRNQTSGQWPSSVRELAGSYRAFPQRSKKKSGTDLPRVKPI